MRDRASRFRGATIGALSFAYLIADTVANIVWGYLADRSGFRSTFIAALRLLDRGHVASDVCAYAAVDLSARSLVWVPRNSGYQMSAQNIVFEFGHRDDMAMRLALSNTAESVMTALGPFAGGLIAATLGYHAVFWLTIVCEFIALVLLLTLVEEPRKRAPRAGSGKGRSPALRDTTSLAEREMEEGGA